MARWVFIADAEWPGQASADLQLSDIADEVFLCIFGDGVLARTFEVAIDGANVLIRTREFDGTVTTVTTETGDTPSAAPATVAHGVSASTPFTLEARYFQGKLEVRINGALKLRYTNFDHEYLAQKHWGWGSEVDGATVLKSVLSSLKDHVTPGAELLFAVCGGAVYQYDGSNLSLIQKGVFVKSGPVSLREYLQKLYGVDGIRMMVVDSIEKTATAVVPTDGTLPGLEASVDGSTRLSLIETFYDRITGAGDKQDPQNVHASALGDPLDWDIGGYLEFPGSAFNLTAANKPKPGQPVRAMLQGATGILLLGCERSTWKMVGDPSGGPPDVTPISTQIGCTGKSALILADAGMALMHAPSGLFAIIGGADLVPLSSMVLTETITMDPGVVDKRIPQVLWDADRRRALLFLSALSGSQTHFIYEQRVGRWKSTGGGLFPIQMPARIGPTASIVWRGRLIVGTRDGFLLQMDRAVKNDDGDPIECRFVYELLEKPDLTRDSILHKLAILLAKDSDPITWKVYGGATPEEAYERNAEWLLVEGELAYGDRLVLPFKVRAPAMVLEISNSTLDTSIAVEKVEVFTETCRTLIPRVPADEDAPAYACVPTGADDGSPPDFDDETEDLGDGPGNDADTSSFFWQEVDFAFQVFSNFWDYGGVPTTGNGLSSSDALSVPNLPNDPVNPFSPAASAPLANQISTMSVHS